jgi:hypothetical protein
MLCVRTGRNYEGRGQLQLVVSQKKARKQASKQALDPQAVNNQSSQKSVLRWQLEEEKSCLE